MTIYKVINLKSGAGQFATRDDLWNLYTARINKTHPWLRTLTRDEFEDQFHTPLAQQALDLAIIELDPMEAIRIKKDEQREASRRARELNNLRDAVVSDALEQEPVWIVSELSGLSSITLLDLYYEARGNFHTLHELEDAIIPKVRGEPTEEQFRHFQYYWATSNIHDPRERMHAYKEKSSPFMNITKAEQVEHAINQHFHPGRIQPSH